MSLHRLMKQEALETPAMLRREAAHWEAQAAVVRTQTASRRQVALVGRGSSGHACTFASYVMMLKTGRHPVEFRPWVTTQDLPPADWSDTVAYAFSSSGHSGDVSEALRWLKSRGAFTVGITDSDAADSPVLAHAEAVFHLHCGPEKALSATKSFTAQLFAAAALAGYPLVQAAEQTAHAMQVMVSGDTVDTLATFLHGARSVAWLARGPSYAGALDAALKTQESLGLPAVAYSTAEFLHGPMAMFHRADRVVLFSGSDEPMDSKQAVVNTLLARGVPFITLGTDATREAGLPIQLPQARWARTPVLAFLAQLACAEWAQRVEREGVRTSSL